MQEIIKKYGVVGAMTIASFAYLKSDIESLKGELRDTKYELIKCLEGTKITQKTDRYTKRINLVAVLPHEFKIVEDENRS